MLLKTTSLILLSFLSSAYAIEDHVAKQLTGQGAEMSTGGEVDNRPKNNSIYNYNEVMYEHIKLKQASAHNTQEAGKIAFGEDITKRKTDELAKRINQAAKEKAKAEGSIPENQFTEGYCYVKYDTEVERIATYAYLSCDFSAPIGRAELVASLVPDFYAKALIAKPLYLNVLDSNRKKVRIPVESGAVLTQNKLSINVANIVNDRKLEKIIASGTYVSLNAATQQAQLYLTDLRASRVKQETQNNSTISGTVTTTTTNVEKPVASDYLIAGGLQIVSELAKVIGEAVVNNLPYTFKINKDSILYADLELTTKKALRGYDPAVPNIIKKQPKYDITNGKEAEYEETAVPIRTIQKQQQY